ncbi:N-acetylmuramoyl-L-alanine amidase [Gorillibacterium sp. sgz5001074]|uniref:N-acetylmuramoyl-L-alanine amidase n=1 Tax=Gorillibacterium sp. sgz5001074 TaxID=3446695 RepID=UPI003F67832B
MRTSAIGRRLLGIAAVLALGASLLVGAGSTHAAADNGVTVVIDPGHQEQGDNGLEPVAPGSKERKAKVTSGTAGVSTGIPEYELNLAVGLLLRDLLEERGYRVVMTRETHHVRISNIERAELGNRERADLVVRIHADGSESEQVQGISLLHPAESAVPEGVYEPSRRAAELLLDALLSSTGASSRGVLPRSDLTGFNWSEVPVVLVEMGFMSNAREDRLMATEEYRMKLAEGMADGIDAVFAGRAGSVEPEAWDGSLMLLQEARLYERAGGRFVPVGTSLTPQRITATARLRGWYQVETWLGPLWVEGGTRVLEHAVAPEHASLELQASADLYDRPEGTVLARLAPQTVNVLSSWNRWLCIDTWLGPAWIRADE